MVQSTSKGDFLVALLVAAVVHVALFFAAAAAVAHELLQGRVEPREEQPEKAPEPVEMQLVYEEEFVPVPEMVAEAEVPVPEEKPEPEMEEGAKEEKEQEPTFVQTREDQAVADVPEETDLIGERSTEASSDEGAEAGDERMAALSGEEERRHDPKTFDSDFSQGEDSGPVEGTQEALEADQGDDQVNQKMVESSTSEEGEVAEPQEMVQESNPLPKAPDRAELPTIDNALAALEEEIGEEAEELPEVPEPDKTEETRPQQPQMEEQVAANQDGGFAPRAKKTRVAGVISASGSGSLNVADSAVGRYQAQIFKKLETAWQMENISNRSLLAPGNITLYFVVGKNGGVSRQKLVAMVGASGTQWGMILDAVKAIDIPEMPAAVVRELEGDPLEIIVTFNY